jgi:hypothetical protein
MDAVIDSIKKQTNVSDDALIEQTYKDCAGDELKAIMKLLNIEERKSSKPPTLFDNIREILDEKDKIYQELGEAMEKKMQKP